MFLLLILRLLERVLWRTEIGAGILPVLVEEQIVQGAGEVVMMGDVLLRLADRVVLTQAAQQIAQARHHRVERMAFESLQRIAHQIEEIVNVAFLDRERAVHVAFAQRHLGVGQQAAGGLVVVNAGHDMRAGLAAFDAMATALRIDELDRARLQNLAQGFRQQHRLSPKPAWQLF